MTPLISIIVPVYKVEPYLRKCVDSILAQTYTNIEVILVDDGSPDGCPAICDEYAAKDRRVVVIHQRNAGVSVARNAGLDAAKGEYIAFVDSDDWIEPDMYEVLYQVIRASGADMAESSYWVGDSNPVKGGASRHVVYSSREAVIRILQGHGEMLHVWGKLFARELIEGMRFSASHTLTQDGHFAIQAIVRSCKIACLDCPCYHYLVRDDSACHACGDGFWETRTAVDAIADVIKKYDRNFSSAADKCVIEFDVGRVKTAEAKGWFTRSAYGKAVPHIRRYWNRDSCKLLSVRTRCWVLLLLLGRGPFVGGRKIVRGLLTLKGRLWKLR